MAKSSNTWQKKLMTKQKRWQQRHARKRFAMTFVLQGMPEDKPKDRDFLAPVKADHVPRGFGKKSRNGCRLSPSIRAMVEARAAKRAEFFAGLGNGR